MLLWIGPLGPREAFTGAQRHVLCGLLPSFIRAGKEFDAICSLLIREPTKKMKHIAKDYTM